MPGLPVTVDDDAYLPVDALFLHHVPQLGQHPVNKVQLQTGVAVDLASDEIVCLRLSKGKGHILEPAPPAITVQNTGQLSISTNRFTGFLVLLLGRHVFQSHDIVAFIRQLDKKNPRIAKSCDFPEGFKFTGAAVSRVAHLSDAIDEVSHMFSEQTRKIILNLAQAAVLVFDGVMQQRRNRPGLVLHQSVNKFGNPGTMGLEIRLSAQAQLAFVKALAQLVSPGDFRRARLKIP